MTELHAPMDAARLIAAAALDRDAIMMAARGLRYVREDWQQVETKALKSGQTRESVQYPDLPACGERLRRWIAKAATPAEVLWRAEGSQPGRPS